MIEFLKDFFIGSCLLAGALFMLSIALIAFLMIVKVWREK